MGIPTLTGAGEGSHSRNFCGSDSSTSSFLDRKGYHSACCCHAPEYMEKGIPLCSSMTGRLNATVEAPLEVSSPVSTIEQQKENGC